MYACCDEGNERQEYCNRHASEGSGASELERVEQRTRDELAMSRMLSGSLNAKILQFIGQIANAQHILEIGTYTGLTAIAFASIVPQDGRVVCLDSFTDEPESEALCRKNLKESQFRDKIDLRKATGTEGLAALEAEGASFDLVFIDADKAGQIGYYETLLASKTLLRPRGIIIVDNTLWSSKVLLPDKEQDESTRFIHAFNKHVAKDPRTRNIILPVRDGLSFMTRVHQA